MGPTRRNPVRTPVLLDEPEFILEPKMDGFRALAHIEGHPRRFVSRKGHVFKSWPQLAEESSSAATATPSRRGIRSTPHPQSIWYRPLWWDRFTPTADQNETTDYRNTRRGVTVCNAVVVKPCPPDEILARLPEVAT